MHKHTGVALAALEKLAARGVVKPNERVVVISTAHGLKFSDFKVGYHEGTLPGLRPALRNPPVKLPATLAAVQDGRVAGAANRSPCMQRRYGPRSHKPSRQTTSSSVANGAVVRGAL